MDGGKYVWGAASYRRTDCSGLTMQCYSQIGVNLSHSVRAQATAGKSVSMSGIQPGDLIILNNRSHIAMYIGDGKMVHAMNSRDGIKVESVSKLKYYRLDGIRRIIE
jgi:cell wall-associated NlpC family hydrolase